MVLAWIGLVLLLGLSHLRTVKLEERVLELEATISTLPERGGVRGGERRAGGTNADGGTPSRRGWFDPRVGAQEGGPSSQGTFPWDDGDMDMSAPEIRSAVKEIVREESARQDESRRAQMTQRALERSREAVSAYASEAGWDEATTEQVAAMVEDWLQARMELRWTAPQDDAGQDVAAEIEQLRSTYEQEMKELIGEEEFEVFRESVRQRMRPW